MPSLVKGQFWKTNEGDVEIMDVGKTLAHYRLIRNEKRAQTQLGGIGMVQEYIRKNKGKLAENPRFVKRDVAAT